MSSLEVDPHLRDSVKTQVRHFASDFSALDQAFPGTYPRMIVRAEGAYLYDEDGHRSLDAGVSLGVCQIGHGRAAVASAVSDQIKQLDFVGLEAGFSHEPVARLAAELGPLMPMPDPGFSFTSSGSEANDVAFKLARAYWRVRGRGDASRSCPARTPTTEPGSVASRRPAATPSARPSSLSSPASCARASPRRDAAATARSASRARWRAPTISPA